MCAVDYAIGLGYIVVASFAAIGVLAYFSKRKPKEKSPTDLKESK